MSVEENKAIVRRFIEEGINQGKLETFDETVAADCPWGEDAQGPEAFKKWCARERTATPDLHITIDDIIAEGNQVVIDQTAAATRTGEVEGWPPPNGKEWKIQAIWILTLAEGKITKLRGIQDSFTLYSQLGYIPTWKEMWEQAGGKVG